jgi:hypothetical protein
MTCPSDAQTELESDISNSEASSSIPVGSQPFAARQKNAAQSISKGDSDDELEDIVSGPRQPNSIKMAVIKNRTWPCYSGYSD